MKRKIVPCLFLLPLMLASCGQQGHYGIYSFQMGKTSGAHAYASIELTDEKYEIDGQIHGEKMVLRGEIASKPASSSQDSSAASEAMSSASSVQTPLGIVNPVDDGPIEIDGYYLFGQDRPNGRRHLKLGFSLEEILGIDSEEFPIPTLTPEIIEQFIYSEIDSEKIYLQIPVSFTDLSLQLYWYGLDLSWVALLDSISNALPEGSSEASSASDEERSSAESSQSQESESSSESSSSGPVAHEPGSKPTAEDIEEINKTYPETHNGKQYRAFYTVSLALSRQ